MNLDFDFIQEFQSSWNNPPVRHALLVHWPIALSALSALFVLTLALTNGRNALLRWIALVMCAGAMATGYLTLDSGEKAEHVARISSEQAEAVLEEHEELGEKIPALCAVCAALVVFTFIPKKPVRIIAAWLAFCACAITAGWVAQTAHYGGKLVYAHGIGMPAAIARNEAPAPVSAAPGSADPKAAFFRAKVKPILTDHCIECHNPSRVARSKSGKLDQTSREGLLTGGRSGPAIVPGKPEDSLLIHRIKGQPTADDVMPPPPNTALTTEQIGVLEQWIREGAAWAD